MTSIIIEVQRFFWLIFIKPSVQISVTSILGFIDTTSGWRTFWAGATTLSFLISNEGNIFSCDGKLQKVLPYHVPLPQSLASQEVFFFSLFCWKQAREENNGRKHEGEKIICQVLSAPISCFQWAHKYVREKNNCCSSQINNKIKVYPLKYYTLQYLQYYTEYCGPQK